MKLQSSAMKLHEAIRLGAMNKPQGYGAFLDANHTCALGAALDAVNLLEGARTNMSTAVKQWPVLDTLVVNPMHPSLLQVPHPYLQPLRMVIVELNDVHYWTRERIALWVERIEDKAELVRTLQILNMELKTQTLGSKHDEAHMSKV